MLRNHIENESIDLILTSPPYANQNKYKGIKVPDHINYHSWFVPIAEELYRVLKRNGAFILNIGDIVYKKERTLYPFELAFKLRDIGFKIYEVLIWNKMKGLPHPKRFMNVHEYIFIFAKDLDEMYIDIDSMRIPYSNSSINRMKKPIKRRYSRDIVNQDFCEYKEWAPHPAGALPKTILNISSETKRISNVHFAVYPEKLCEYFIKGFSKVGNVILDPFIGSGTTAVVAQKLNRKWIGIEIVRDYCDVVIERIK